MFKRKGGGVKGLLNNVKKTALFLQQGFPKEHQCLKIGCRQHTCNIFLYHLDIIRFLK